MAQVDILDWEKKKVGTVELSKDIFEAPVKRDLLHRLIRWQRAGQRQGTHQAKTRAMVRGGGAKPFRQKGTGNARQGSSRSPLLEGGGVIFPPKTRDYSYTLPRKVKQAGLRSALSYLYKKGHLTIVENMESSEGKARELSSKFKAWGLKKALLVDESTNEKFKRASGNLKGFLYRPVQGLNVYDLLKYDHLILTKTSLASVAKRCGA